MHLLYSNVCSHHIAEGWHAVPTLSTPDCDSQPQLASVLCPFRTLPGGLCYVATETTREKRRPPSRNPIPYRAKYFVLHILRIVPGKNGCAPHSTSPSFPRSDFGYSSSELRIVNTYPNQPDKAESPYRLAQAAYRHSRSIENEKRPI